MNSTASPPRATPLKKRLLHSPPLRSALLRLLRGYTYSTDVRQPPWEYATSLAGLVRLGCDDLDVRWLVDKGYLLHAVLTPDGKPRRRPPGRRGFPPATLFALTDRGARAARRLAPALEVPVWRPLAGELWFHGQLARRFEDTAENQRAVLAGFEKSGWERWIRDPLPKDRYVQRAARLRDTVKCLNRGLQGQLLRFGVGDNGQAVGWWPVDDSSRPETARP